jgi:hypothetical protein
MHAWSMRGFRGVREYLTKQREIREYLRKTGYCG